MPAGHGVSAQAHGPGSCTGLVWSRHGAQGLTNPCASSSRPRCEVDKREAGDPGRPTNGLPTITRLSGRGALTPGPTPPPLPGSSEMGTLELQAPESQRKPLASLDLKSTVTGTQPMTVPKVTHILQGWGGRGGGSLGVEGRQST